MSVSSYLGVLLLASYAAGQLTGSVGPTTSSKSKQTTICNVLDYGGTVGSSDIGPAILSAFTNCVLKYSGSTLYIPEGDYDMETWVTLSGGSHWALQLDGVITRTSTTGGHMFYIQDANDFEFFSSNSAGAIQGNGYQCRDDGPRLIRIVTSSNWSLHELILVNSPEFHVIIQEGSNGEIYNLVIRGADIGGYDGIDISGDNHWVHDVEVTNRDECVTVKNPASNLLIERIWCNQSGGSAIGSLGSNTTIENIIYQNVYTNGGNQIFMIKSNLGMDIIGDGVELTGLVFKNWDGIVVDGVRRPPYYFLCADGAPCNNITLDNVNLWSWTGEAEYKCESAYGKGACLKASGTTPYAATSTSYTKPAVYTRPATLSGDLASGFATDVSIPVPTIPETFYPELPQITPLAKKWGSLRIPMPK